MLRFDSNKPLHRIARNAASLLVSSVAANVFTAYALALSALSLGAARFGALNEAQAWMEPFRTLTLFGMGVVTMTLAAKRGGVDGALLGTASVIHLAFALVSSVLAVGIAAFGHKADVAVTLVVAVELLLVPLNAPANVPLQFDQAMHKTIAIPSVAGALRLGLLYVAISKMNTPAGHQLAATAAGLVGTALTLRVARRAYRLGWTFEAPLARQMLALAWPAAVLEVVVMIYSKASYQFLKTVDDPTAAGVYALADRFSAPVLSLASAVVASSLPSVARMAASGDTHGLWGVYRKAIRRSLQVLVPVAVLAALAAPWLLARFFPDYVGAEMPFRLLLVGVLFMFLNQISSMFIIGVGRFRMIMSVAIVNLFVYLALATVLVPRYKAAGAALSTTLMEGVNAGVQLVLVAYLLRRQTRRQETPSP